MEPQPDRCPTCGTPLSQAKLLEVRKRRADEEAALRSRLEAESRLALEAATRAAEQRAMEDAKKQIAMAEKRAREEADKRIGTLAAERDHAATKVKALEAREATIRKQVQDEADKRIATLATERDRTAGKLKELEAREATIKKQALEEAEQRAAKLVEEQRGILQRDRDRALLQQQAVFNRERESYQKKMKLMERQLERRMAHELGDGAELDVFEALRDAFPDDRITRIRKGQPGADILHEVLHKGEVCGRIVLDSKNRQLWQYEFVQKLRQDQLAARADHAILATTTFPSGKKELTIEGEVIVAAPGRVVAIVELLREATVKLHVQGLSRKARETKMTRLYAFITSEAYAQRIAEAGQLTTRMLELEVEEQRQHQSTWQKRGTLLMRITRVHEGIGAEISAILEGDEAA